ncbi:MAG TPA: phosphoenolpyruvate mutase [Gammaproteobacteria bacterium]|nr:phosphoenolpyruvate mutase [Gammaproteobacteria bacterium]
MTEMPSGAPVRKTTRLRRMLQSPELEFILEAHNGLSARIVEEAGFQGIWASGLAISAQFGVRDNNEASWTQVVDVLEFMSDVTRIPILLDGDTGYGNFNNMRRLVRKLEQRGVAGVCIEDKIFPKTNSFIGGERQPLADVAEFCGKIAAGKDSQQDDDFSIVARVEALIAGWDIAEALRRAEAYRRAGADAILIHSKLSRPDQILEFAREWADRAPLVIVPTKYYSTPTEAFRRAKVSLVIWANHMIRSAVSAMQATAKHIHAAESLADIEDKMASVDEIFRLQGANELEEAEERYLSSRRGEMRGIVLAASRGDGFASLTDDRPKVMLPIAGKPLLRHLVDKLKKRGVDDITVVAGYKAESIDVQGIKLLVNREHASTGELASLACAREAFADDMVIVYGDVLFRSYILRDLVESEAAVMVVVDSNEATAGTAGDYAYCSEADDRSTWGQAVRLEKISAAAREGGRVADGRWIGMLRFRGAGRLWLDEALDALRTRADFAQLGLPELLNHLVAAGKPVHVWYVHGHWLDVNSVLDLENAGNFAAGSH